MTTLKEYWEYYIQNGFVPIKCRGYHPEAPKIEKSSAEKDRKNAKIAIASNFTKDSYVPPTYEDCAKWVEEGGWLGWRVPKNVVALDVDKDINKNLQMEAFLVKNKIKWAEHSTKDGKHYFFRTTAEIKHNSKCLINLGIDVTVKPAVKSYLILAPMEEEHRKWKVFVDFKDISFIPDAFLPLDTHNKAQVLSAIIYQIKYYYHSGVLSGYDDIDLPFGGFLVDVIKTSEEEYCKVYKEIFDDAYDEYRTVQSYKNIINKKDHQSVGTLVKNLQAKHLEHIVQLLSFVSEDNDNAAQDVITQFNARYCKCQIGNKMRIIQENMPIHTNGCKPTYELEYMTYDDFKLKFKHLKIPVFSNGKRVMKEAAVIWYESPGARQYERLVFYPKKLDNQYYNLWQGFAYEPRPGCCDKYLQHLKENICSNNDEYYTYLLDWMADVVQHPEVVTGVAVVIQGAQGTGKGMFATNFTKLFGHHGLHLTSSDALTNNFNSQLMSKVVIFSDEAFWGGDKKISGLLKGFITEETIRIELKGIEAFTIKNYMHLIVATNNDVAIPAEVGERRYFCLKAGESKKQNHAYFTAILDELHNGGYGALLHMLLTRDISKVNIRLFPRTEELLNQQTLNLQGLAKFLDEILAHGDLSYTMRVLKMNVANLEVWPTVLSYNDLYEIYRQWCIMNNDRHPLSIRIFPKKVRSILRCGRRIIRQGETILSAYAWPSVDEGRDLFKKYVGNSHLYSETFDDDIEIIDMPEVKEKL